MPNNKPLSRDPHKWNPITTAPEGQVVLTKIHDNKPARNEQELVRQGQLWFFPDKSMYVYYTPTHWRPVDASK